MRMRFPTIRRCPGEGDGKKELAPPFRNPFVHDLRFTPLEKAKSQEAPPEHHHLSLVVYSCSVSIWSGVACPCEHYVLHCVLLNAGGGGGGN
uniref:Uncharacterized protein n=1 Tax=Oncorhynchus kisutch TaxID=8019 RepID=A0A8C7H0Y4_ONCKI